MLPTQATGHARALLESLLAKPSGLTVMAAARRASNGGGAAVASTAATAAVAAAAAASPYRPQKPSSLASSSSANHRDEEEEDETLQAVVPEDKDATPEPTPMQTPQPSLNVSSMGGGSIAHILQLLDDQAADEEERIENVRSAFGDALEEVEGARASPSRLDGLVLELLHRHREDVRPTGATFAPLPTSAAAPTDSPRRRPPSLRSFSNAATPHPHTSRPWTPTAAAAAGAAITPPPSCAAPRTPTSVAAGLPIGSPLPSPGIVGAGWGDMSGETLSPRGSEFPGSIGSGGSNNAWPSPTPLSASAQAYGVIGSGSPRASPRLWHRPSSLLGATKDASASGSAAAPWSNALGLPPSPSYTHSVAGSSLGSVPPGGLLAASLSSNSRPASPSPLGSPRLNVGASEFKPRVSPTVNGSPAPSASARPESWLGASGSVRRPSSTAAGPGLVRSPSQLGAYSTSSASGNGGSSIGETSSSGEGSKSGSDTDEADEFSPFAVSEPASSTAPTSTRPSSGSTALTANAAPSMLGDEWYGSSTSASSASGSYGAYDASPLALMGDEESAMMSMTPFDVLCSIVNAPTSNAASSSAGSNSSSGLSAAPTWSAEQIEDALAANGWDVDATLAAIMDSGGVPPTRVPSGPRSSTSPGLPNAVAQPRYATGAGRSGVSLMPREAFVSHRLASASPATSNARAGFARGASPITAAAQQQQQPASPRDQVGPGRVCRYFLAGECRRADCRFSHDLGRALCRFWLRGQCLNNPCTFLHDSDVVQALATGIASTSVSSSGSGAASSVEPQTPPSEDLDFPELGLVAPTGPKGAKKVPGAPSGPAAADPSRTRWAAALQRSKASTPLALVASGEAAIPIHARGAPTRAPPSGPKALAQPAATAPRASSRIPLRAPVLMPTLATGSQAAASYIAHRNGALILSEQRNKCFARAGEAWKAGDGATARHWSAEGQKLNAKLAEESKVAAGAIIRERHATLRDKLLDDSAGAARSSEEPGARGLRGKLMGSALGICLGVASRREVAALHAAHAAGSSGSVEERTECLLDLHGMHAEEAVGVAEEFLMGLERESFRGLAFLACGIGLHTSTAMDKRRVGLKSAVKAWLNSWQYPYQEYEGILAVDPLTHG